MVPDLIWSTVLMTPTMPAAGSMWPRLVFTEPTSSGASLVCDAAKASPMAPNSIGSPSGVPVPCASTYWTSSGARCPAASALRMTFSWAGPLGTVRPALSPSCPTAVPRTRASTVSPSRVASLRRLSTTTPHPSARA